MIQPEQPLPSEIQLVADRLMAERPVPAAAFRGDLRRALLTARARPRRFWLRVGTAAGTGSGLLTVAGLGVLGAGPLAG